MQRSGPKQASPALSPGRRGYSLVDLIVTVGLIATLVALFLPALGSVRESARRTVDISNLRQLTQATVIYAHQNSGMFPPGRLNNADPGEDDYTWVNSATCWKPLLASLPALSSMLSCASVKEGYPGAAGLGQASSGYDAAGNVQLGWVYWAGRDDLYANGRVKYRSCRKYGDQFTPGSQTLWTCWCWDSAGGVSPSICPHVGNRFVQYPPRVALKPPPDGLVVALTDGSASFVAWGDLTIVQQYNGFKLYYQP